LEAQEAREFEGKGADMVISSPLFVFRKNPIGSSIRKKSAAIGDLLMLLVPANMKLQIPK
jgi:hypothetical protein